MIPIGNTTQLERLELARLILQKSRMATIMINERTHNMSNGNLTNSKYSRTEITTALEIAKDTASSKLQNILQNLFCQHVLIDFHDTDITHMLNTHRELHCIDENYRYRLQKHYDTKQEVFRNIGRQINIHILPKIKEHILHILNPEKQAQAYSYKLLIVQRKK